MAGHDKLVAGHDGGHVICLNYFGGKLCVSHNENRVAESNLWLVLNSFGGKPCVGHVEHVAT